MMAYCADDHETRPNDMEDTKDNIFGERALMYFARMSVIRRSSDVAFSGFIFRMYSIMKDLLLRSYSIPCFGSSCVSVGVCVCVCVCLGL